VTAVDEAGAGRRRQNEVYRAGVFGRMPRVPVSARALQKRAERVLDDRAYSYVAGGAGDEVTQRANRAAFDKWAVVPRVLRDCSSRDTSVEIFGRRLPAPLLLGPVGALELVHDEADLAVARAAASVGVPMVFSNQASVHGGVRRGHGGRSALVPALLVDLRRAGREPGRAGRGGRAATPSSSPSTPRCSAGARATSTSGTCRSRWEGHRAVHVRPVFRPPRGGAVAATTAPPPTRAAAAADPAAVRR
jgi:hypothetical protein